MSLPTITIVGTGNLAYHLAKRLKDTNYSIVGTVSRDYEQAANFNAELGLSGKAMTLSSLPTLRTDFLILAIPDQQIHQLANKATDNSIVIHLSGAEPMNRLSSKSKHGVVYPLQTFTKEKEIDWSSVLFLIEGNSQETTSQLLELCNTIGGEVKLMDSEKRKKIHMAAVIANNFTNCLLEIAEKELRNCGLELSVLSHLLTETISKAITLGPHKAQTGPALRRDEITLQSHLSLLDAGTGELYLRITKEIQRLHPV